MAKGLFRSRWTSGALAIVCSGWVLGVVALIVHVSAGQARWSEDSRAAIASLLLLVAGGLPFLIGAGRRHILFGIRRAIVPALGLYSLGLIAVVIGQGQHVIRLGAPTFASSLSEEALFRYLMPQSLGNLFVSTGLGSRVSRLIGQGMAQLTFALAHLDLSQVEEVFRHPGEAVRLFTAGVMYACLTNTAGLWLAVAVHGINNVLVIATPVSNRTPESGAVLGVLTVAGLTCLWLAPSRPAR